MKSHNYSFFGQKVGMIFSSADWEDPSIYLRFLKKKPDNNWEKPSNGEGKNIKLNLLEIIAITSIFHSPNQKWTTVHKFKGESTPITVENNDNNFVFLIPGYQKWCRFPETTLLLKLFEHCLEEKIINATGSTTQQNSQSTGYGSNSSINDEYVDNSIENSYQSDFSSKPVDINLSASTRFDKSPQATGASWENPQTDYSNPSQWIDSLQSKDDYYYVKGEIRAKSQKAVAFKVKNSNPTWVPLSCVENENVGDGDGLWIKQWFIKKKAADLLGQS